MASFSIHPFPACRRPRFSPAPPAGIWGGGAGDGREGEMKARHLRQGEHQPLPHCPLLL